MSAAGWQVKREHLAVFVSSSETEHGQRFLCFSFDCEPLFVDTTQEEKLPACRTEERPLQTGSWTPGSVTGAHFWPMA